MKGFGLRYNCVKGCSNIGSLSPNLASSFTTCNFGSENDVANTFRHATTAELPEPSPISFNLDDS